MDNKEAYEYFLSTFRNIDNLCEPIKNHYVKFFSYMKIYNDNSYINLSNWPKEFELKFFLNIKKIDHYLLNNITLTGYESSRLLVWPEDRNSDLVYSLMYEYNIWNGITLIVRHKDYVEIFSLGTDRNSLNLVNSVINNQRLYLDFIDYFKLKSSSLIAKWDKNKYAYFAEKSDLKSLLLPNKLAQNKNLTFFKFSKREEECFRYLLKGYTAKQTALELNISPRTVETYISIIKEKTGCNYKSEMIKYFSN